MHDVPCAAAGTRHTGGVLVPDSGSFWTPHAVQEAHGSAPGC